MIKSLILDKVRTFQAKAGSMWGQKEAEAIWSENAWKLGLELSEIKGLQDGWAKFVVNGDRTILDSACQSTITRLSK